MLHDALRISKVNHKSINKGKVRRPKLRGIKRGFLDKEAEVPFYESGAFWKKFYYFYITFVTNQKKVKKDISG